MFVALGVDPTRLYSSAKTKKFSDFLPKIGVQRRMLDRKFHHRKNNGVHQANERENTGKWGTDP